MSEQNINSIRSKFKSGNAIPVTRAWITREEYIAIEELQARVKELEARRDELLSVLHRLACLGNGDRYGNSDGNIIAQAAIAKIEAEAE